MTQPPAKIANRPPLSFQFRSCDSGTSTGPLGSLLFIRNHIPADSASSTGSKLPGILPGMGSPVPGSNPVMFCSSRKDIPAAPRQRVRRDFLSHCFIAMILSKTAVIP